MVAPESTERQFEISESVMENAIASDVSLDDYLEHYAADHCEWVEGWVIKMAPATLKHNKLMQYLYYLLDVYFTLRPIGQVISQPFVLRLPEFPNRRREPDLIVLLDGNPNELKATYMDGAPDICIEIVSAESTARDHGDKFAEYEAGGVPEYWIIDPVRQTTHFYRLNEQRHYVRQPEDEASRYHPAALPGLVIHVPMLWQEQLPDPIVTVEAVKAMIAG